MEIRLEGLPMWLFLAAAALGTLCAVTTFGFLCWIFALFVREQAAIRQHDERAWRGEPCVRWLPDGDLDEMGKEGDEEEEREEDSPSEAFWRQQINRIFS